MAATSYSLLSAQPHKIHINTYTPVNTYTPTISPLHVKLTSSNFYCCEFIEFVFENAHQNIFMFACVLANKNVLCRSQGLSEAQKRFASQYFLTFPKSEII